ncbi:hypothetical protein V2E39_01480 [Chryseobacterium arthrosphaerae]|uniref:DUF3108 domain-containing protein n=1 Tax=Chryseobacterium arthrosphaerae TaxID=651561 RepID=A0ABU7QU58_9FLAO|nr:hypothetical protein [Chryseobacterium sp. AG363]RKE80789.1 hypothetical protein DEU39_0303 [Chryseobacterium sp. AG363]
MYYSPSFIKTAFKGIFLAAFLLFFTHSKVFSQNQVNDQGHGKMVLKWYLSHIDHQEKRELYYKFTYYMNGNLVLRQEIKNDSSLLEKSYSENGSLTVSKIMPTYLINISKALVRYKSETDSSKVEEVALADYGPELFYKCAVTPPKITMLDTLSQQTLTVAGHTCIKGKAHILNSDFEFAYTKSRLNVKSPLNLFVPNFPYQILWIKIPLDNNPQGIQTFVIESTSETIPENIKNSITW